MGMLGGAGAAFTCPFHRYPGSERCGNAGGAGTAFTRLYPGSKRWEFRRTFWIDLIVAVGNVSRCGKQLYAAAVA